MKRIFNLINRAFTKMAKFLSIWWFGFRHRKNVEKLLKYCFPVPPDAGYITYADNTHKEKFAVDGKELVGIMDALESEKKCVPDLIKKLDSLSELEAYPAKSPVEKRPSFKLRKPRKTKLKHDNSIVAVDDVKQKETNVGEENQYLPAKPRKYTRKKKITS